MGSGGAITIVLDDGNALSFRATDVQMDVRANLRAVACDEAGCDGCVYVHHATLGTSTLTVAAVVAHAPENGLGASLAENIDRLADADVPEVA